MEEIDKTPAWQSTTPQMYVFDVVGAEQLITHDRKYKDDNAHYKGQVAQGTHCLAYDC